MSGKLWGYNISMFSDYPNEKEILIEPERKVKITSVARNRNVIFVDAEIVKTPLVLEDFINVKVVKIKEKKSGFKGVPGNFRVENVTESSVELSWTKPDGVGDDKKIHSYRMSVRKVERGRLFNRNADKTIETKKTKFTVEGLETGEEYEFRVQCKYIDGWGYWGDKIEVTVIPFKESLWKKCPNDVDKDRRYSVYEENPRTAVKTSEDGYNDYCTIIGNTPIPPNKVTSWSIKILKSKDDNDGKGVFVGVAPSDIDQNEHEDYGKYGWYFGCYESKLISGPPHNYWWDRLWRKEKRQTIRTHRRQRWCCDEHGKG